MLTKEILKSNTILSSLPDDAMSAIEQLSKNDEEITIGKITGEIHRAYDKDFTEITGLEKPGGVKSYEHWKTVFSDIKMKADAAGNVSKLTSDLKTLQDQNTELKAKIAEGKGNEALAAELDNLKRNLSDKESELRNAKDLLSEKEKTFTQQIQEKESELLSLNLKSEFESYVSTNGIQFKKSIPETVLTETLQNRQKALIQSLKPDFIDDGNGGKKMVFRDDKGEIMRNKENGLNPYTAAELYSAKIVDIIDTGRKQPGVGTSGTGGDSGPTVNLSDLSRARTKVEADEIISKYIHESEGLAKIDPSFSERQKEIRLENDNLISSLPLR